ncbi:MAG: cupin domain-containing protein [Bacteroidales bacterium]|nr:cupin domain-containing protein [Bacteroidales bacterium]
MKSLFDISDYVGNEELFEEILDKENLRIERIVSSGQTSPDMGWYDQDVNEFVILIQGTAELEFDDGTKVELKCGDYLNIPAHKKHRVTFTSKDPACIWIAVFYK